ncbi:PKD domain-containing protein [bacterium]|nr:PKD domain-containing protein [bacterium]
MRYLFLVTIALSLLVCGCSSNSNDPFNNPVTPAFSESESMPVGVSDRFPDGSPAAGFGVMGVYNLELNPEQMSAELISLRTGALTDTLEVVDITNFLSMAPCTDCAKIKSVSLDVDGNLVVSIGIKHPFEAGDPLKPITGRNRGDLHVFNVEGIVAAQDASTIVFPAMGNSIASVQLINASGYTPYLDDVLDAEVFETDADIHPYILHFDDYTAGNFLPENPMGFESVTDPPPSGNLVMAMGCDYDYKDYVFDLSAGDISYTYAIGCTYAVSSASKNDRFTPEYRVPQHQKKAASEINVIPLTEMLKATQPLETVTLQVEVVDPSHGVAVGEELNEMAADSSVGTVGIEIPGVIGSIISQAGSAAISGTGHDPTDPLLFEITFGNELSATEGIYTGLIKVTDAYPPGNNESPLLNGMDGIKRVGPVSNPLEGLFDISEFATYATFEVEVERRNPPVADITVDVPCCVNFDVTFDASGSTDIEDDAASIPLNFEFDFDYDGITFDIDRAMSTDPIAVTQYSSQGIYTAAVRVTDSDLDTNIATVTFGVGVLVPGDPEIDITDGVSITDIDYAHGTKVTGDFNWPGAVKTVTKGTARGDGYMYIVFYGVQGGTRSVFLTKSNDNGLSWSTPVSVHDYDSTGEYGGCSIAADDTGIVLIVWADCFHRDLFLEYSLDHGDTFASNEIRNYSDTYSYANNQYRSPDVAIDPTNSDNITIITTSWIRTGTSWFLSWTEMYIHNSTTGPSGTFNEALHLDRYLEDAPYSKNIFNAQVHYAVDGDAYMLLGENARNYVYRSSDSGATWPNNSSHRSIIYIGGWHREMNSVLDPTNPDVFYMTRGYRNMHSTTYPIKLYKATNGLNLSQIQAHVNDSTSSIHRANSSVAVDDGGIVYVMWQSEASGNYEIMVDYSCDGGATFGTDAVFNAVDIDDEIDCDLLPDIDGAGVICVWEQDGFNSGGKLVVRQG